MKLTIQIAGGIVLAAIVLVILGRVAAGPTPEIPHQTVDVGALSESGPVKTD
jgi:hypothetical protein